MKYLATNVRINTSGDALKDTYDVVVEVLKDGQWVYHRGFNSFSNDYAFSSANEAAMAYARNNPVLPPERVHTFGKMVGANIVWTEYETFISDGAILFPHQAYVAYEKGACPDDIHAYGATPEEAVANLRELVEA